MQSVANIPIRRGFVALTVAFALVIGCTWGVVKVASDYLLHHNTKMAAQGWARLLVPGIPDLGRIAAGERPSAESLAFFDWAHRAGSLFRFEIYDRQGNLQLASEPGFMLMDRSGPSGDALRVVSTGEPILSVREGAPGPSAFFGHALVPVVVDGRPIAAIGTYVDQTARRDQFHGMFITAAASLSLLTALAFGIPTAAWYRRTREKDAAERRVLDNARRAEQLAEQALAQHGRFEAALANMPHGLCMFDAKKRLVICNARYREMYNLPATLVSRGRRWRRSSSTARRIGNAPKEFPNYVTHDGIDFAVGNNSVFEFALEDGRTIRINHLPLSGGGYVATHEDMTEAVRAETQITHMARHDALTDLPNRVFFREQLQAALDATSPESRVAVLCVDLDNFKGVNDTLGHPVGRRASAAVADRLRGCVDAADTSPGSAATSSRSSRSAAISRPARRALARAVIEAIGRPYRRGRPAGRRSARASASRWRPTTATIPTSCSRTPTWRSTAPRATGAAPTASSSRRWTRRMQARRRLEVGLRASARPGGVRAALPAAGEPARATRSPASRRCCAGAIPSAAWSRPASSFRWPRRPG